MAIGRHLDPELTPDTAAERISARADLRAKVRAAIVDRAPQSERASVSAAVDKVLDDWMDTAREQTAEGGSFVYAEASLPQRLLVAPLDPALPNLRPAHQHFVASRSMRDVEPNVVLKILGPNGQKIVNAQDVP